MYMTNLYAYDKKLYLIKGRLSSGGVGSIKQERSQEEISRDILGAYESCRERREESFYISALRDK